MKDNFTISNILENKSCKAESKDFERQAHNSNLCVFVPLRGKLFKRSDLPLEGGSMSKEIPGQCKFIETCTKPVTEGVFKYLCQTADWVNCDWVNPQDYREFLLSPAERLKKAEKPSLKERNKCNDKDADTLREDLEGFTESMKEK